MGDTKPTISSTAFKVFVLDDRHEEGVQNDLAVGRDSLLTYMLISPTDVVDKDGLPETRNSGVLNKVIPHDPRPSKSADGLEAIWVKNYTENEGIYAQLLSAGVVRDAGFSTTSGHASYPLAYLIVPEEELIRKCGGCLRWEKLTDAKRYKVCSRCRKVYYCSDLERGWKNNGHKEQCPFIADDDLISAENKDMARKTSSWGFGA